jgi:hypothetical protein
MHTNRISLARKFLFGLGVALAAILLAGCQAVVLSNLTPASLPENPSQIYTITLRATPKSNAIVAGSVTPHTVIDGQNCPMTKRSIGENLWEFD